MRGRFAAILAATLIAYAGCFFVPDRPSGQSGGDDGGADDAAVDGPGQPRGDASTLCASDDMADMSMACGTWGVADTVGASMIRANGVLQAMVSAGGTRADCVTQPDIDFSHGASIELVQPLQGGSGDTTRFVATFDNGGFLKIETQVGAGGVQIFGTCSGAGGFATPAQYTSEYRYLRISVTNFLSSTVAAAYSNDGATWTTLGSCSLAGNTLATAKIRIGAAAGSGSSLQRAATFDNFKTCTTPP